MGGGVRMTRGGERRQTDPGTGWGEGGGGGGEGRAGGGGGGIDPIGVYR